MSSSHKTILRLKQESFRFTDQKYLSRDGPTPRSSDHAARAGGPSQRIVTIYFNLAIFFVRHSIHTQNYSDRSWKLLVFFS